jgi:uncharacterized protein
MGKPFLSARWKNLLMANYAVDPALLKPLVPEYTELDIFNGECLVSLVAFQFLDTRVKGFRIPWHVNFPEINLRFYLKRTVNGELRRGVAFIAEIVPRHAITFVANTLFNEKYKTRRMSQRVVVSDDRLRTEYTFVEKAQLQKLACSTDIHPKPIKPGSLEDFITEHYYGYTQGRTTLEYRVEHPSWRTFAMRDYKIDVDFKAVYGEPWGFLKGRVPHSVLLAEGSEVNVYGAQKVKSYG